MEPTIYENLCCFLGFIPVSLHELGAPDDDFSLLSRGEGIPMIIHDPHFSSLHRQANGTDLFYPIERVDGVIRPGLRQSPAFDDLKTKDLLEFIPCLQSKGRRA